VNGGSLTDEINEGKLIGSLLWMMMGKEDEEVME
jgi:hypothetical protein